MWSPNKGEKVEKEEQVVVAIDKDKSSQYALKWAVEHVVGKSKNVTLLHVKQKPSSIPSITGNHVSISDANEDVARTVRQQLDIHAKELFLPFRCFCNRKDIKCQEVIAEDTNISKAIIDYVATNMCEIVVVGASSRNGLLRRLKGPDVPTAVSKNAPDFCTVYVISKRKIISVRSATRPVPVKGSSNAQRGSPRTYDPAANPTAVPLPSNSGDHGYPIYNNSPRGGGDRSIAASPSRRDMEIRSPFTRGRAANGRLYGELPLPSETDISYVGNSPSRLPINNRTDQYLANSADRTFQDTINYNDGGIDNPHIRRIPRLSTGSNHELDRSSFGSDRRSIDLNSFNDQYSPSASSNCSGFSTSSLAVDDVESEMRRLRQELKQTMDMYNAACKDAITAKQKAKELQVLKAEERQRLEDARSAEEAALTLAEKEKAKCKAALEAAEAAQKIAELEAQKRMSAEMKAIKEAEEKKKALQALTTQNNADVRYRRYTIEEIEIATDCFSESLIIGEGGYGPVYKCTLDHTPVAIKVLRPDAAQGQTQFQQEVEILSCIRHPNMVLLLGACPEYGCLVYEFMSNGSLEDRLFCKGNTPILPWQVRFRIAAEIGTGLLFLHQTKPEPLVHRDLKPANILLDRNFTSKICDVGLARLVPPSVADGVTRYRMTQTAGTFCYIDPEYQQTGMLGIKSDIYSLGIILLQLVTGKLPIGLTHYVERAIEKGNLVELLDPRVKDWPIEETVKFVKLALRCAELRRKDRPDLRKVVLPELNKFREFAEDNMVADGSLGFGNLVAATTKLVPHHPGPTLQEVISDPQMMRSGSDTPKSRSSSSFLTSAA